MKAFPGKRSSVPSLWPQESPSRRQPLAIDSPPQPGREERQGAGAGLVADPRDPRDTPQDAAGEGPPAHRLPRPMPVGSQAVAAWVGQPYAGGAGALAAALLRKPAGLPEPGQDPAQEPAAQGWASSAAMVCSELLPETALGLASSDMLVSASPLLDLNLTFRLHSNPNASKVIYLDFDGHTTSGTSWNDSTMGSSFYSPAYDVDGNPSLFSDAELIRIQQIWQQVAADFAPFDVDVSTMAPPRDWMYKSGSSDMNYGIRIVVTSFGPSSSNAGGIAFIDSFVSSGDTPAFVYNTSITGGMRSYWP